MSSGTSWVTSWYALRRPASGHGMECVECELELYCSLVWCFCSCILTVLLFSCCYHSDAALDLLISMAGKMMDGGEGTLAHTSEVTFSLATFLKMVRPLHSDTRLSSNAAASASANVYADATVPRRFEANCLCYNVS
jgi:hypothetical protein